MGSMELPRKVTVYGAKWPGDEDHQRAIRFFKKYVKVCADHDVYGYFKSLATTCFVQPVLVAAAIDYDVVPTRQLGDLTRLVALSVVEQRRVSLGLDPPPTSPIPLPNQPTYDQKRVRELEGGVILIGRHTLKEYLAGLKRGWSGGLEKVDREEELAQELAADGTFDEAEDDKLPVGVITDTEVDPIPTSSRLPPSRNSVLFPPLTPSASPPTSNKALEASRISSLDNTPPFTLPPHPPLLLVPFINHIGFRYIPHMIWSFFNERHKVREGCEAAYALIGGHSRDFRGPETSLTDQGYLPPGAAEELQSLEGVKTVEVQRSPQGGDLDFMLWSERLIAPHSPLGFISDARKSYYSSLPTRLVTARQLARGEREMTKEEVKNPPASEVELRAERLQKELKWRSQEEGWDIVRPGIGISWDERFRGVLKVFETPEGYKDGSAKIDAARG
ncbi:hypothetical protein ID866_3611 [Astraeus odoratus]|nr:hypothetical protein ID866_3611 [Astraeus odoratus]